MSLVQFQYNIAKLFFWLIQIMNVCSDYLNYVTSSLKTTGGVNSHTIYYPVSTTSPVTGPHMPNATFNNTEMKRLVDDVARLGCCPITVGPITFTNSVQRSLTVNIHYGKILEGRLHPLLNVLIKHPVDL